MIDIDELKIEDAMATALAGPPPLREQTNSVYGHLVDSEDDLVGLVAYALYKQDKRDWIVSWQRTHANAPPTADQLDAFLSANVTPGQRTRYRKSAEALIDAHAGPPPPPPAPAPPPGRAVDQAAFDRIERTLRWVARGNGWFRHIVSAILGGIIGGVIVIAIAAVLQSRGWVLTDFVPAALFSSPR